jgi:hypothetical protein
VLPARQPADVVSLLESAREGLSEARDFESDISILTWLPTRRIAPYEG